MTDMAEEELSHEHQLDEIVTRVNVYRVDGIAPELFLTPFFLKYFPVVMEPGVLTDVNWNNISGLFVQSPVLPMTYVDNEVLLAMSRQQVWETDTNEGYHPRHSLAMVKYTILFPSAHSFSGKGVECMVECRLSFTPSCWNTPPACPATPRRGTGDSVLEVSPGTVLDPPGILDTTSLGLLQ